MIKAKLLEDGLNSIRSLIKNSNYREIQIDQDGYIVKQNEFLDCVYWADFAHYSIQHTSENGKVLSLGEYRSKNRFFGEFEFFSDRPCQFDVIASEDITLVVIPNEQLTKIITADSIIAFWMSCNMSSVYQTSMDIAIERALYPLKYNILKDMLRRHTARASSTNHMLMYKEAQRFGCTERAYNRVIHELIEEGLIKKEKDTKAITLTDINKIANCLENYNI